MWISLIKFFSKGSNIIISIFGVVTIILIIYSLTLSNKVKDRDNTILKQKNDIITLTNNVTTLTDSINKQNTAIELLNKEHKVQVEDFNKRYNDVKISNKGLLTVIEKQKNFVREDGLNEYESANKVKLDFIKNRGVK